MEIGEPLFTKLHLRKGVKEMRGSCAHGGGGGGGRVPGKGAASAKAPQSRRLEWLETIRKEELQNEDIVGEEEIM